jgi:hypothetical protein
MRHKNKQDSWRRLYVRLLTEPINTDSLDGHALILELNAIDDLIKAGYMIGKVNRDTAAIPLSSTVRRITLSGHIFAEQQQDILKSKSTWGIIKSNSTIFIGWLAGIISAIIGGLILWYFTKPK